MANRVNSGGLPPNNVDLDSAQTLSTKTLDSTNELQGSQLTDAEANALVFQEQGATPTSPAAGDKKLYAKDDGKLYTLDSSGNEIEVGSGAGGGGILYINEDFETGVSNLVAYADTAQATPVDGTGGSPNVAVTAETASPLIGDQSAQIAKDAADRQGEGVAILSSTVDEAYEDKVHTVEFLWKTDSNYADGDMALFVVHPTTGTVEALNFRTALGEYTNELPASSSTVTRIVSELTPIDPTYRIVLHVASTSATAYEVFVDNIQCGPQRTFNAPIVTEWESYDLNIDAATTAPTPGTVVTDSAEFMRHGKNLFIRYTYKQSSAGSSGSGTYLFPIPPGLNIDTTNMVVAANQVGSTLGSGSFSNGSTQFDLLIEPFNSTTLQAKIQSASADYGLVGSANGGLGNTTVEYSFITGPIPIQGWDAGAAFSTTQVDQQTVRVRVYQDTAQSLANSTHETLDFNVVEKDDFNLYDTTGDYIEVPRDGWGYVHVASQIIGLTAGTGSTDVGIQLDSGAGYGFISLSQPNAIEQSTAGETASIFKYFNKGDKIRGTQRQTNGASRDTTGSEFRNYMEFFMLPDFSVFGTFPEYDFRSENSGSSSTAWPFTANQYGDFDSFTLPVGVWEFTAHAIVDESGGAISSGVQGAIGIGVNSGNNSAGLVPSQNQTSGAFSGVASQVLQLQITNYRITVTTPTTYYLKGFLDSTTNAAVFWRWQAERIK